MGGMQALFIGLHHTDTFAYIASLSGPMLRTTRGDDTFGAGIQGSFDVHGAYDGAFANPERFNKSVKLLWLGVGTAEEPILRQSVGEAAKALKSSGVRLVYFEAAGTAHEWQTWRRDLEDLAPRLFH
jgi:enterochelin esterase-like enzyme